MNALLPMSELMPDPMARAEIPFGEWLPDQPPVNNSGAVEALNVLPADGSYVPFPSHSPGGFNETLSDPCRGAIAINLDNDSVQIFAGTVNGLASKIGGGPWGGLVTGAFSDEHAWQFIRTNEQVVLMHQDYAPGRTPVGSLASWTLVGGNPPHAACGAQVGDFLMLGNLLVDPDDGGTAYPARVRWSGFNNIDAPWITSTATQADFQDMPPEGGPVIAIAGRDVGTIFQERVISRATYRGPPDIFEFAHLETKRGALGRDCVVDLGANKFFIAEDGFFLWNGTNSVPIGDGKVNRYFFNRLQYNHRSRIVGAVDFANGCIVWAFPTSSSGVLDEMIMFSYRENRWAHSIQTMEYIFNSAASNITLDELTASLESYTTSFDSPAYQTGGRSRLAGFNQLHTYGLFDGVAMEATMDTAEFSGENGRRVYTAGVRPVVDLTSPVARVSVAMRDQMMGQALSFSTPVLQEIDGQSPILADARYMRFRVNLPAGAAWTHAVGVDVMRKQTGIF